MTTGREASIERRKALSQGQAAFEGAASTARRRPSQGETAAVGRRASVERRRQLSSGKAAIGAPAPAPEQSHQNDTPVPAGAGAGGTLKLPNPAPEIPPAPASAPVSSSPSFASGREASIERRRQLSGGLKALPDADLLTGASLTSADGTPASGREASRLRRLQLSAGRSAIVAGSDGAAPQQDNNEETETPTDDRSWTAVGRTGERDHTAIAALGYPPKVVSSRTHFGQSTTGLRIGPGERVTGDEDGATLPVTGNQYYGEESGVSVRARPVKVGAVRTPEGQIVSGTLVRSNVTITGDERGDQQRITGEADQIAVRDDITPRGESYGGEQFPRRTDPHGHTAAAAEFLAGTSGRAVRAGRSGQANEFTVKGYAVSGTAVGRSERVTGDEDGSDRWITGTQYTAADRATAPATVEPPAQGKRNVRRDPVTGAKVVEAQTFGGQRITGPQFEHEGRVTGSEAGSYVATTGTPYQGPASVASFMGPEAVPMVADRVIRRAGDEPITGDAPRSADGVTGTQRGAERDVTGTPYYRDGDEEVAAGSAIAEIDREFSIASPQRRAHLRAAREEREEGDAGRDITGSFATGHGKITGNQEFLHTPRTSPRDQRPQVSGEGASAKNRITGDSWRDQSNVTGTEGYIASNRNPTQKGGQRHGFAGAMKFRPGRPPFEPEHDVTGILLDKEDAALTDNARVTVSGGALS